MYDVAEKTIDELQRDMEQGITSSEEITLSYLMRIAKLDQSGPKVNSVLEINPDAVFIARALDRERKMTGPRGPMHGIPVLLKDNISTCDKMHTSAGAAALADNFALADACVVEALREAGAVILGKTNLSEFARYMTMEIPNGFSARGGQTINPHGAEFDPLGSSTGSAVAAAMSFAAVTVGTETSGSIISPSHANGIVGLKPTIGVVSRSGIIPINSQDTAGPMGRTVQDVAILLGAMTGEDMDDPATLSTDGLVFRDYTKFLKADALKGVRVGICPPPADWCTEAQAAQFRKALTFLEQAGAELVEGCDLPEIRLSDSCLTDPVLQYEFKRYLDEYLAKYCSVPGMHTLNDIIRWNNDHAPAAIPYGQSILEECARNTSGRLTEPEYLIAKCRALREAGPEGIDRVMAEKNVDVIVSAAASDVPPTAGYPMLSVPAGNAADGRPVGLSFTAGAFSEPKLLAYGYAFEQASHLRVVPIIAK